MYQGKPSEDPGPRALMGMATLPAGTVTLLFSDIEGSTPLLQKLGDRWPSALGLQRQMCREAWAEHGGHEIGTEGDSFFVVFIRADAAVSAADVHRISADRVGTGSDQGRRLIRVKRFDGRATTPELTRRRTGHQRGRQRDGRGRRSTACGRRWGRAREHTLSQGGSERHQWRRDAHHVYHPARAV
jgi:class 3 adenylate cyclase